ncbi:MAG TPA: hypothetical protein PKA05_19480 [Roseiflexaceae bacterium]|nr:hypothetical protein [Roseiflexaceae bacterium]HMP42570.1 hypothetical protein [Roseiflexaceae bacterium]
MTSDTRVMIAINPSSPLEAACHRFLGDLRGWVCVSMACYADAPPTDTHDQATLTTTANL